MGSAEHGHPPVVVSLRMLYLELKNPKPLNPSMLAILVTPTLRSALCPKYLPGYIGCGQPRTPLGSISLDSGCRGRTTSSLLSRSGWRYVSGLNSICMDFGLSVIVFRLRRAFRCAGNAVASHGGGQRFHQQHRHPAYKDLTSLSPALQ